MATGWDLSCNKERSNFLRLSRAIIDLGTSVLNDILSKEIPPNDFKTKLKNCKTLRLNPAQKQRLNTPTSQGYKGFDITLLYTLIRNLCSNISPTNGWSHGYPPTQTEVTIGDDVERIHFIRNYVYGHMTETSIQEAPFQQHWQELEGVMARVDLILGSDYVQNLALIKDDNMDLDTLKSTVNFEQMKDLQQSLVTQWCEDELTFCETRATQHVREAVKANTLTVITGPPGSGKSAIAHHVAMEFQEEYCAVPVDSVEELEKCWKMGQKQMFVMDDVFGVHTIDEVELGNWYKRMKKVQVCLKNNKIIMTVRKQFSTDERFNDLCSKLQHCITDVGSEQLTLTNGERKNMFEKHMNCVGKNTECNTDVINCKLFCFPLLCRIFAADNESKLKSGSFFKHPFAVLQEEVKKLKHNSKERFLGLVMCAVYDNKLPESLFDVADESAESIKKREDFAECCDLQRSVSRQVIRSNLNSLIGTYVLKEGVIYRFIHDIIYDVVVNSLTHEFHLPVLKHCSSKFIKRRVRFSSSFPVNSNVGDVKPFVILDDALHIEWAKRLVQDVNEGKFYNVFFNVCLQDETNEEFFVDCLEKSNIEIEYFCKSVDTISNLDKEDISEINQFWYLRHTPFYLVVAKVLHKTFLFLWNELDDEKKQQFISSIDFFNLAAMSGNIKVVQLIIDNGGHVNKHDMCQKFPLHYSSEYGHDKVVQILVDKGADLNKNDKLNGSPLHYASQYGHDKVVQILVDKGAKVNECDKYNRSHLHYASLEGHDKVVQILVDKGAKVNECDMYNTSPLHYASLKDMVRLYRYL